MAEKYWIGGTSGAPATAANWSDATAPVNGDTIVFDGRATRAVDASLTGLSAVTVAVMRVDLSMIYNIGTTTAPLVIGATVVEIGRSETSGVNSSGPSLVNLNLQAVASTVTVWNSNTVGTSGLEPIVVKGTSASNALHLRGGVMGIATLLPDDVATFATINIDGGKLTIPNGCTLTTINMKDGELKLESAATTLNVEGGTATTLGAGAITTINLKGNARAILNSSGTITTLHVADSAVADFSGSSVARTITNATKHSNSATINARTAAALPLTWTNGIDCDRCSNVGIDFGDHITVTPSAI